MTDSDQRLTMKVNGKWRRFTAHADGLVTVKVAGRERSAMAGGLGPYGIARLLIMELEREADNA